MESRKCHQFMMRKQFSKPLQRKGLSFACSLVFLWSVVISNNVTLSCQSSGISQSWTSESACIQKEADSAVLWGCWKYLLGWLHEPTIYRNVRSFPPLFYGHITSSAFTPTVLRVHLPPSRPITLLFSLLPSAIQLWLIHHTFASFANFVALMCLHQAS